jgi:subtilisin family serine protease
MQLGKRIQGSMQKRLKVRRRQNLRGMELRMEALEERQLLASDVGTFIHDLPTDTHAPAAFNPFIPGAIAPDALTTRASQHAYAPGQLIVARTSDFAAARGGLPESQNTWSQLTGIEGTTVLGTLLQHQTTTGERLEIVHLDLGAGSDVVAAMKGLETRADILWSSPNYVYEGGDAREFTPNDPRYPGASGQYHHPLMRNDLAWDITLGSPTVTIGVTDDGVSRPHVDLTDNIWINPGEVAGDGIDNDGNGRIDDVNGWDFISNDNNPNPNGADDHGTHVAGIAAGRTDNGVGIAGTAGRSTIMPLKFYDSSNPGAWTSAVVLASLSYGVNNGAKIITTSYNIDGFAGDPTVTSALQYIHDNGRLHFNSAGNNSQLNPPRQIFEQTLLVASTEAGDVKSGFSNYGTGVDIAAPGGNILSTVPGNNYDFFSGTSMATPNAAGVAALIWSANPGLTHTEVAARLLATADNIDGINAGFAGLLGTGRVNSFRGITETVAAPRVKSLLGLPATTAPVSANISSFSVAYNQVMNGASVRNGANYELRNAGPDGIFDNTDDQLLAITNTNTQYLVGTNLLNFSIGGGVLGYGQYRLSILSGGVSSALGTALDGNGDGTAGDHYQHVFSITLSDFVRVDPTGGLVSVSAGNSGSLSSAAEIDAAPFYADQGELISAIVTPSNPLVTLSVQLPGDSGVFTAPGPGQPVILPPTLISTAGNKTLEITGTGSTSYSFDLFKNADVSALMDTGAVVALDASRLELGSSRFAALGNSQGSSGGATITRYNNPGLFVDISAIGTALNLTDDSEANITTTVGNSLLGAGAVRVGNNGVIFAGPSGDVPVTNLGIPSTSFSGAALAPFWDDIDSDSGNVYWREQLVGGINTLIVQWNNRPHYSNVGSATFQLQLFASGPVAARYVYPDVDFGNALYNNGASATIGYQTSSTTGAQFSINSPSITNGDVLDIAFGTPTLDTDEYGLDLTPYVGKRIDISLAGTGSQSFAGDVLQLVDPGNVVLATGTTTPAGIAVSNYDQGIAGHLVTAGGVHQIRVSSGHGGQYAVVVTEDLVLETEPNLSAPLRSLDGVGGAVGFFQGRNVNYARRNDPSAFVDISGTGTPLALGDDDETTISTSVGNELIPAGSVTVSNNGGILQGSGVDLPASNGPIPAAGLGRALLAFWDDIDSDTGSVFWREQTIGGINALIVQWNNRPHFSNVGSGTIQIQLFESGPIGARFVYPDVDFGDAQYNFGASATIGFQASDSQATAFSTNTPSIANNDVIDIIMSEVDSYSLSLLAGQTLSLRTSTPFDAGANVPLNNLDPALAILDSTGAILASDLDSADGKNADLTYTATADGTYTVEVSVEDGVGEYVLHSDLVTGIDGDFNDDGNYDCLDVNALTTAIATGGSVATYDLNGDSVLNTTDLDAWLLEAGENNIGPGRAYILGDANLSGFVDGSDFGLWNANKFTTNSNWCDGNFNADGVIDGSDFGIWNANKFTASDSGRVGKVVPAGLISVAVTDTKVTRADVRGKLEDAQPRSAERRDAAVTVASSEMATGSVARQARRVVRERLFAEFGSW